MNGKGQALTEMALLAPILFTILIATVMFAQWFLIRQKLIVAAREAALLYSSGRMKPGEVEHDVKRFASRSHPLLDPNSLEVRSGPGAGWEARLLHLDQITVKYRCHSWLLRYFASEMEETCVIKHAPHYGPPWQTLYGPPVPW